MVKPNIVETIEGRIGEPLACLSGLPEPVDAMRDRFRRGYAVDEAGRLTALNVSRAEGLDEVVLDAADCASLRFLNLSGNSSLKRVTFGGPLPRLERLDLSESGLESLRIPAGCERLEKAWLRKNRLGKCVFEAACPRLQLLDLSQNPLGELTLPAGFDALAWLYLVDCQLTRVTFQTPENDGAASVNPLPRLETLHLAKNRLERAPDSVLSGGHLTALYLGGNTPRNIPHVFLGGQSQYSSYNCLEKARIWFGELSAGESEPNKTVKLMLTGNGGVGKTTLVCALKNEAGCCPHPKHDSTHGIQVERFERDGVAYNVWDFGGQEIYYSTHRLFLESPALQVIVFDAETEALARRREKVKDRACDDLVRHHELDYWYESIRARSPRSEFVIVENLKGREDGGDAAAYARKKGIDFVPLNAKTGDNLDDLQYYLQKHSRKLPEYGMDMPCSWLSVRSFFVDNLATQDNRKLITTAEFEALCDKHGVNKIGRPLLLDYLHHHGYLYRHKNLGDRLIADQRWALEAIYKPLERGARHYEDFKQQRKGRIPVWQLFEAFGGGYTEDEKWLFLEFMRSCGLCFQLNTHPWREGRDENDVYVFPQFLPEGKPKRVERFWQRTEKVRYMKYTLRWLNDELIQAFIVELGRKTEPEDFWRHGIHVDTDEGSFMAELDHEQEALLVSIEEPALEKWAGPIMEALSPGRDREGWLFSVDGERFESVDGDAFRGIPAGGRKGDSEPDGGKNPLENLDDKHQRLDEVAVLVVAANPTAEKVSLRSEHSKINEAFDGNEEAKRRYPVFLSTGVTREKLIDEIYDKGASRKGVIVHFVGHGRESRRSNGADGGIVLHGDGVQQEQTLSGRELRDVLDDLSRQRVDFRMVFLNACHTASLAETIGGMGVPAVGIDDWQSDDGAPPFAAGFYRHFARTGDIRQSLRTAVTYGIAEDSKLRRKVHLYIDGERCPL